MQKDGWRQIDRWMNTLKMNSMNDSSRGRRESEEKFEKRSPLVRGRKGIVGGGRWRRGWWPVMGNYASTC